MELELRVRGAYWSGGEIITVPELIQWTFDPVKSTDDPMLGLAFSEVSESELRKVMKIRKDAAKILSENITKLIINAMKKHDTHNGYPS